MTNESFLFYNAPVLICVLMELSMYYNTEEKIIILKKKKYADDVTSVTFFLHKGILSLHNGFLSLISIHYNTYYSFSLSVYY